MVSNADKWVRIFDIPDISKHKRGFTIYKVISMLYPENCPDAITKVTVWKRYNDFKKLHRDMKSMHQTLKLNDKFPGLPRTYFFKRFDEEIIQERRQLILTFLDYVSSHSKLYTSNEFVKFFETSHTPSTLLNSSINSIRADLNLPSEPEYLSFHSPESDGECTISDTDSVSTMSSLSPSAQLNDVLDPLVRSTTSLTQLSKKSNVEISSNPTSQTSKSDSRDSLSRLSASTFNTSVDDFQILDYPFPTPPQTPGFDYVKHPVQYINDAAHYILLAAKYELEKKYDEAFVAYKQGIDILLRNAKEDKDEDRRQMVRFKTEKYLLRAEKLYNLYLSPDIKNIQELTKKETDNAMRKSLSDLYKYKVIKVLDLGMTVLHSDSQQLFYIKGIHKPYQFSNDNMILPTKVPYMIDLYNFYNCENVVFLVLQHTSAVKLWDYIKHRSTKHKATTPFRINSATDLKNIFDTPDNDFDCSYADLINEYASDIQLTKAEYEINKKFIETTNNQPIENKECLKSNAIESVGKDSSTEIDDILTKSQELIESVDLTLKKNAELKKVESEMDKTEDEFEFVSVSSQRCFSSYSSDEEEFECEQFTAISLQQTVKWCAQLLLALEDLHKYGVICCDLRAGNLLIDENEDLVITYKCKVHDNRVFNNKTDISLAPELYSYAKITPAADWWSFGAILYEMLVGMPVTSTHPEGISTYTTLKIPKFVSVEGKSLLKQLLVYEAHSRLNADEIRSHPFFNSVSWRSLVPKFTF